MDRFDDDTLFAELRELRPEPRPGFTAELDRRAAAGFPRGERSSATAMPFKLIADWWRGLTARKRLIPALGFAVTVLAVAAVVVASQSGSNRLNVDMSTSSTAEESLVPMAESEGAAESESAEMSGGGAEAGGAGGATRHAEELAPSAGAAPNAKIHGPAEYGPTEGEESAAQAGTEGGTADFKAGGTVGRNIERSSYIVLGTKPDEVPGAAAKVFEAVHAAGGYVLNSSVQSGTTGATGASFDLLIPSAKLNDALATFSSIAEVRQRHDATNDITAPTVSAAEELADSNATIDSLLKQLGDAETEAEQESVEARLREERRRHAGIRASLDHLHQRASMSEVTLRIVTDHGAGVTPPSKDSDSWGLGDALHSAGHILTIAAGVVLIGLAILAPFVLVGLIIWAGNRFRVRRLRERTLG